MAILTEAMDTWTVTDVFSRALTDFLPLGMGMVEVGGITERVRFGYGLYGTWTDPRTERRH